MGREQRTTRSLLPPAGPHGGAGGSGASSGGNKGRASLDGVRDGDQVWGPPARFHGKGCGPGAAAGRTGGDPDAGWPYLSTHWPGEGDSAGPDKGLVALTSQRAGRELRHPRCGQAEDQAKASWWTRAGAMGSEAAAPSSSPC